MVHIVLKTELTKVTLTLCSDAKGANPRTNPIANGDETASYAAPSQPRSRQRTQTEKTSNPLNLSDLSIIRNASTPIAVGMQANRRELLYDLKWVNWLHVRCRKQRQRRSESGPRANGLEGIKISTIRYPTIQEAIHGSRPRRQSRSARSSASRRRLGRAVLGGTINGQSASRHSYPSPPNLNSIHPSSQTRNAGFDLMPSHLIPKFTPPLEI